MKVQIRAAVKVGIGDVELVKRGEGIGRWGLGCCVGVVVFDEEKKVAGVVHVMVGD
ncbi:hypothetical protein [Bacillus pumilus]|uniref:hypothetical protein n=1 Tax=Bacillus pumilus TaxID=1408 RepID=UPI001643167F|nr:hypothetical protein [Bacillus pumilus]